MLIDELIAHPDGKFEVGRQRRREVVLVAASRYDEMIEREDAVRDLAWAVFATDRVESPTSEPVGLEDARVRRRPTA